MLKAVLLLQLLHLVQFWGDNLIGVCQLHTCHQSQCPAGQWQGGKGLRLWLSSLA